MLQPTIGSNAICEEEDEQTQLFFLILQTYIATFFNKNTIKNMKHLNTIIMAAAFLPVFATTAEAAQKQSATKTQKQEEAQKRKALSSISEDAARAHVYFLADDLLEGRRAGERGSRIAKQYIIAQMRQAGVKPWLNSGYEQPFEACARQKLKRGVRFYVTPDSIAEIKKGVYQSMALSNVLGIIRGERDDEYIVVGAHLDHEGMYPDVAGDNIYNGADDNASGVSAVLQIMKAFAESGAKPKRNIIFAFWDGEEQGLLGSQHFTDTFGDTKKIKGYLNFDMVGRNNKPDDPTYMVYFYTEAHPTFGSWLKEDIAHYDLHLNPSYRAWDKPVGGSDNGSFAIKNVPIIWYHTDGHPDYNQPTDEADRINYPKLTDITRAAFLSTWHLANVENY